MKDNATSCVKRCRNLAIKLASTAVSACVLSTSASADDLFEIPQEALIDIKITSASMFAETRQYAVASTYRAEEEQWTAWDARRNLDALSNLSGISTPHVTWGGQALAIRGFTQLLSARGVATMIDGVAVNDLLLGSAQYDNEHISLGVVDSIELIKGPGSTLYGTDVFHGVLSFNTYYSEANEVNLNAQIGSFDYSQSSLKVSQPLGEHFINIALDSRRQQHWGQDYFNINSDQMDSRSHKYENTTGLIKLHNGQDQLWDYQLSYYYNLFEGSGFIAGGHAFGYQDRDLSRSKHSLSKWQAKVSREINDHAELGVTGSHWKIEREDPFANRCCSELEWEHALRRYQLQGYWRWQDEKGNRLHATIERSHQQVDKETTNVFDINGNLSSSREGNAQGYFRNVNSVVLQGRRQTLHQPLQLEIGARLDDYSDFGNHMSPRLGAIYQVNPQHTAKLLYGTAFRAAVSVELFGTSSIEGNPSIDPEELETWELAYLFKTERWQSELLAFKANWHNGIIATPNGSGKKYENADGNTSQGLELSAQYRFEKWQVSANSSWTKSENTVSNYDYVAFPEWQLKAEVNYHINRQRQVAFRFDWRDERSEGPITTQTQKPAELAHYLRVDANIRQ